jgi:hypothetical protein
LYDVRGIYGKLSNKSKFHESGLNGGVALLESSSAIQMKSGLENLNVMPLSGYEFCANWCSDNCSLLNCVPEKLHLLFTLCTIFTNVGKENFYKNYGVTLGFLKMGAVGAILCLGT